MPTGALAVCLCFIAAAVAAMAAPSARGDLGEQTIRVVERAQLGLLAAAVITGATGLILVATPMLRSSGPVTRRQRHASRTTSPDRSTAYTIIAFGSTPDETRGIQDAPDAVAAIDLLWSWSNAHPEERAVVFGPSGEPLAYRRPSALQASARHSDTAEAA